MSVAHPVTALTTGTAGDATPRPPGGSRWRAAARFAISVLISGAAALLIARHLSRRLVVVTDIVGYPTHADYNFHANFNRYYLAVLFFPACSLALYLLIGKAWPRSRWPATPREEPPAALISAGATTVGVFLGIALVGATLGVGWAALGGADEGRFWADVLIASLAYTATVLGISSFVATVRKRSLALIDVAARVNAVGASLAILSLHAASGATRVVVQSDGSVHRYPWFPGWLAWTAIGVTVCATMVVLLRGRDAETARRAATRAVTWIAVPALLVLFTAVLPGAFGAIDTFHGGEFLAGAHILDEGAFPWRDSIWIHGLLQDVLMPLVGFKVFGDSVWGGSAGFWMFLTPVFWICHYLLFLVLFRRSPVLLGAAVAVPLLGAFPYVYWRFAPLPIALLALTALLQSFTPRRAFALAFTLVAANVVVPELAYAIPACGIALVGYELSRYRRGAGFLRSFRRTSWTIGWSIVLTVAWFAFLARHGALRAFFHYYATFAPGHELTGAVPVQQQYLHDPAFLFVMVTPPLMLMLGVWYVAATWRARRELDVRDWVMVAAAIVTFAYSRKFLSRPDWHVIAAFAPAIPLLYYAVEKLLDQVPWTRRGRVVRTAGACAVLALTLFAAPAGAIRNLARVPGSFTRLVPLPSAGRLGWGDETLARQGAALREIGGFLDAHLERGDVLFDFTNQPGVYHYVLGRKPASRYYHVSMAIRRETQLDLIRELAATRPKLVVFQSDGGGLGPWDGVPDTVRHYEVSHYLLREYRPFARVGGDTFYVRADLKLPLRRTSTAVVPLSAPEAYATARPCDWGHAPLFLRPIPSDQGPPAARDGATSALRLAMSGWAADPTAQQPAREIVVVANGARVARAATGVARGDVAAALGAATLASSGFELRSEWSAERRMALSDLHVFALTRDGRASEIPTRWRPAPDVSTRLSVDGAELPVVAGAVTGSVDFASIEAHAITTFVLPDGLRLPDEAGLEMEIDSTDGGRIEISDSFTPGGRVPATSEPAADHMALAVRAHTSGPLRVFLDSCPQWYAFRGQLLHLRHPPGVRIRSVRVLQRAAGTGM